MDSVLARFFGHGHGRTDGRTDKRILGLGYYTLVPHERLSSFRPSDVGRQP